MVKNREAYIERIHGGYHRGYVNGAEFIEGFAKFVDHRTVEVNGEKIWPPTTLPSLLAVDR